MTEPENDDDGNCNDLLASEIGACLRISEALISLDSFVAALALVGNSHDNKRFGMDGVLKVE